MKKGVQRNLFENIKEFFQILKKSRLWVLIFAFVIIFSILISRMFQLQIIMGEEYQNDYTYSIVKERTLNSTRGNIYDRNGKLLAYNELAYSITIEDNGSYDSTSVKNKSLNAMLAEIITEIEKNGDSITNNFKISYNEDGTYSYNVSGTALKRFLADVYGEISYKNLGYDAELGYDLANATPDQVMEYLMTNRNKFGVSEEYDKELAYKIVVIRYAMSEKAYQKYISTTIATEISDESVAYISENMYRLQGVEIIEDTIRRYNNSEYFAAIIGYTGKISAEEYEELSADDDRYTLNDVIGKAGIEQVMDKQLQGSKGYEKLYVDYLGKTIELIEREEATAGNDVYLSIDADLTIAAYDLMEQEIAGIVYSNIENYKSDIPIPITDVYFALINNNVIDIEKFSKEDADPQEKEVYSIFVKRQSEVLSAMENELLGTSKNFSKMNDEEQDYITYIINYLKGEKILNTASIDKTDTVYKEWQAGNSSVQTYLNQAIAKGWIDITQFVIDDKYSDSTEIYQALCEDILAEIESSKDFSKIIYQYMVEKGSVTGKQLCLILFEQGILPYDDEEISKLESGAVTALSFIKGKIKDLSITPAQLALDPCTGSCVLTDVGTGEVLAVVSYPGYDNNRLANTIDSAYYASLQKDLTNPFYNKATQERTAPGSTFKPVVATAGLVEGVITVNTEIYDAGPYENVSNHPKCWKYPSSHGSINVAEAIRDSCNYFFYEVGYRLSTNNYLTKYSDSVGIEKIKEYASMFGFDETTGIEIVENSPQIADEYPVMAAIGQSNHNFTTVQLARYVTAIANSGTVYNYSILKKVCDKNGAVLDFYEPTIRNTIDVLDASGWNAIHSGMRMVAQNSSQFRDFEISVAGKTGTAQQDLKRANHALFIGYAPYENPEISIAVRIPFGYTSANAAHYARNILSYYFEVEEKDALLDGQAVTIDSSSNAVND